MVDSTFGYPLPFTLAIVGQKYLARYALKVTYVAAFCVDWAAVSENSKIILWRFGETT